MSTEASIGITIGSIIISILVARHFYLKQKKAETIMATFIESIVSQAQSVCNSLESVYVKDDKSKDDKSKDDKSIEWIMGLIEGTSYNMNAVNGTLKKFYKDYFKKILVELKHEE